MEKSRAEFLHNRNVAIIDPRQRTHLERMLAELDQRLVRLTDTTAGPFDEAAIVQIANLETARSAVVRLLKGGA